MVKKESCELSQGGLPMLLFHIADIHLGKSINGMPLIDDQRYWINEFLKKCDEKDPDAVLIAGDVYDRVNPGPEAVAYFAEKLDRAGYKYNKGSIQIPYSNELPLSLIAEIAAWCRDTGNHA